MNDIHIFPMTQLADQMRSIDLKDAALAKKVGCSRSMITRIRGGKAAPSLELALAIARETGVPVEALLPPKPGMEPGLAS